MVDTEMLSGDETEGNLHDQSPIQLITTLRQNWEQCIAKHSYQNAASYAKQALDITDETCDVYRVANAYFCKGEYHRAIEFLHNRDVLTSNRVCRYLAAKCHVACKEWDDALTALGDESNDRMESEDFGLEKMESVLCFLRGTIYESLEKRETAKKCYKKSLHCDVYNEEAFLKLTSNHMLTQDEEAELLKSLPWNTLTEVECQYLKIQYEGMRTKYGKSEEEIVLPHLQFMKENVDYLVGLAHEDYVNLRINSAFEKTVKILERDPYHERCLLIHIGCLVTLGRQNDLFLRAHRLVYSYPNKSLTWYAVGSYYYLKNNLEKARRYFSKATDLGSNVGESLIALGHSFAADGEHDQAMIAYCSAARLISGSHLPNLFIGMEYVISQDYPLAFMNLEESENMCSNDPLVFHERGVAHYKSSNLQKAEACFQRTLGLCVYSDVSETCNNDFIHTVLNNLGHTYRKLRKYAEARREYEKSFNYSSKSASTYAALGFTRHLEAYEMILENPSFQSSSSSDHHIQLLDLAIEDYHKALSLNAGDPFCTQMLDVALRTINKEMM